MNMIEQHIQDTQQKRVDIVKKTQEVLERVEVINKEYHYLLTISHERALEQAKKLAELDEKQLAAMPLAGLFISIKDCICVKDVESTAGSAILKGYKPVFDATAVEKLEHAGAIIIGKANQDAFGFGSFNTNVGLGNAIPKHPLEKERVCGGSSGGSAGLTRLADFPHVAIAESTGGSIACPASFCGVYSMTPTYGLVSRWGLIDYANSLDKIGVMSTDIEMNRLVLNVIKGGDKKDATSIHDEVDLYAEQKKLTLAALNIEELSIDAGVKQAYLSAVDELKKTYDVKIVNLAFTMKYALETYYILAMSEASTNLAKYCGLRYGNTLPVEGGFNEYFSKVRGAFFNKESKLRAMIGTFTRMAGFRDQYYIKAAKIRRMIIEEYKQLFKDHDVLLLPTMSIFAPKLEDAKKISPPQMYAMDLLTVPPNLAGMPHVTVPLQAELPTGLLLVADHFNEAKLYQLAKSMQNHNAAQKHNE